MANGWASKNVTLATTGATVSGVTTGTPITVEFPITAGGSKFIVLKCKVSAITQVGTVTVKLQTALGADWVDAKTSASLTTTGDVYLRMNNAVAGDQASIPLLNKGRVVAVLTNAGDSLTVSSVEVLQEL